MSDEIYWLTWNIVLTAAMVIPYALYRMKKLGGLWNVQSISGRASSMLRSIILMFRSLKHSPGLSGWGRH